MGSKPLPWDACCAKCERFERCSFGIDYPYVTCCDDFAEKEKGGRVMAPEETIKLMEEKLRKLKRKKELTADELVFITTFNESVKALKKDVPLEPAQGPIRYGMGYDYHDFDCPTCGMLLAFEPQGLSYKRKGMTSRCKHCGQLITWHE